MRVPVLKVSLTRLTVSAGTAYGLVLERFKIMGLEYPFNGLLDSFQNLKVNRSIGVRKMRLALVELFPISLMLE